MTSYSIGCHREIAWKTQERSTLASQSCVRGEGVDEKVRTRRRWQNANGHLGRLNGGIIGSFEQRRRITFEGTVEWMHVGTMGEKRRWKEMWARNGENFTRIALQNFAISLPLPMSISLLTSQCNRPEEEYHFHIKNDTFKMKLDVLKFTTHEWHHCLTLCLLFMYCI